MKMHLQNNAGANVIRAHTPGEVRINDQVYARSLIVTPSQLVLDWGPANFAGLDATHFEAIATLKPELVLLGTGARLQFPSPALTVALMRAGIGLETMDTAAACRTYNILMGEGRQVAAALLLP